MAEFYDTIPPGYDDPRHIDREGGGVLRTVGEVAITLAAFHTFSRASNVLLRRGSHRLARFTERRLATRSRTLHQAVRAAKSQYHDPIHGTLGEFLAGRGPVRTGGRYATMGGILRNISHLEKFTGSMANRFRIPQYQRAYGEYQKFVAATTGAVQGVGYKERAAIRFRQLQAFWGLESGKKSLQSSVYQRLIGRRIHDISTNYAPTLLGFYVADKALGFLPMGGHEAKRPNFLNPISVAADFAKFSVGWYPFHMMFGGGLEGAKLLRSGFQYAAATGAEKIGTERVAGAIVKTDKFLENVLHKAKQTLVRMRSAKKYAKDNIVAPWRNPQAWRGGNLYRNVRQGLSIVQRATIPPTGIDIHTTPFYRDVMKSAQTLADASRSMEFQDNLEYSRFVRRAFINRVLRPHLMKERNRGNFLTDVLGFQQMKVGKSAATQAFDVLLSSKSIRLGSRQQQLVDMLSDAYLGRDIYQTKGGLVLDMRKYKVGNILKKIMQGIGSIKLRAPWPVSYLAPASIRIGDIFRFDQLTQERVSSFIFGTKIDSDMGFNLGKPIAGAHPDAPTFYRPDRDSIGLFLKGRFYNIDTSGRARELTGARGESLGEFHPLAVGAGSVLGKNQAARYGYLQNKYVDIEKLVLPEEEFGAHWPKWKAWVHRNLLRPLEVFDKGESAPYKMYSFFRRMAAMPTEFDIISAELVRSLKSDAGATIGETVRAIRALQTLRNSLGKAQISTFNVLMTKDARKMIFQHGFHIPGQKPILDLADAIEDKDRVLEIARMLRKNPLDPRSSPVKIDSILTQVEAQGPEVLGETSSVYMNKELSKLQELQKFIIEESLLRTSLHYEERSIIEQVGDTLLKRGRINDSEKAMLRSWDHLTKINQAVGRSGNLMGMVDLGAKPNINTRVQLADQLGGGKIIDAFEYVHRQHRNVMKSIRGIRREGLPFEGFQGLDFIPQARPGRSNPYIAVQMIGDSPFLSAAAEAFQPYNLIERFARLGSFLGVGLSPANYQTARSYFLKGVMGKRVLLGAGLFSAWQGVDSFTDECPLFDNTMLGEGTNVFLAEQHVKNRLRWARLQDAAGITSAAQWAEGLMPGFTQFIPGVVGGSIIGAATGRVGSIMALAAAGGLFNKVLSDMGVIPDWTKKRDELIEIYSGREEVPVRRGRFWEAGRSPYEGGRIAYWRPHWFPRMKAQAMFTPNMRGSKFENMIYGEIPLLGLNPIGTVLDPAHYERRHYLSRPYPETGALGHEMAFIGPTFASTIGRFLKPRKIMHRQELEGVYNRAQHWTSEAPGVSPFYGPGDWNNWKEPDNFSYTTWGAHQPNSLVTMNPSPKSKFGIRWTIGEQLYRGTEMAGLYGFATESFMGGQPFESDPILANAGEMTSTRRAYWNLNLGGILGGCFIGSSRVKVPNGWRKIKDISVGDQIISMDGSVRTVLRKINQGRSDNLVCITTATTKSKLVCTVDHKIPCWKDGKIENISAGDLIPGMRVLVPILQSINKDLLDLGNTWEGDKTEKYVYSSATKEHIQCREYLEENPDTTRKDLRDIGFNDKTAKEVLSKLAHNPGCNRHPRYISITKEFMYFLGWYLAEGSSEECGRITLTLGKDDDPFLEEIYRSISSAFCIPIHTDRDDSQSVVRFSHKPLMYFLRGEIGTSSHNKRIPFWCKVHPLRKYLFKGLMLGDGFCNDTHSRFTSSSTRLCEDLFDIGLSLGVKGSLHLNYVEFPNPEMQYPQGGNRKVTIRNYIFWNPCIIPQIQELLYGEITATSKKEGTAGGIIRDGYFLVKIKKIHSYYSEEDVYDLEIDGLPYYIVDNICVHNSEYIRRFLPRIRTTMDHFNPLRNKMPHWLPGGANNRYFIDFTHGGDPYTRIDEGEIRLPGPAYESMHNVRFTFPAAASWMGKPTERIVSTMLGLEPPMTEDDLEVTEMGNYLHHIVQEQLARANLLVAAEAKVWDPFSGISGSIDAIIRKNRQQILVEIKTTDTDSIAQMQYPKYPHYSQLNTYMKMTGIHRGIVLYVSRDDPEVTRAFDVTYSQGRYDKDLAGLLEARRVAKAMQAEGYGRYAFEGYSMLDRLRILADTCIHPDEEVITEQGIKTAKDVVLGEKLYTHNGEYKEVIKVFNTEQLDMVSIRLYGTNFVHNVSTEHPFLCVRREKKDLRKDRKLGVHRYKKMWGEHGGSHSKRKMFDYDWEKLVWVKAAEVNSDDYIVFPIRKRQAALSSVDISSDNHDYTERQDGWVHRKVKGCNRFHKTKIDIDEDFCRFLGLYAAEGSSYSGKVDLVFASEETDLVEFIEKYLKKLTESKVQIYPREDEHCIKIQIAFQDLAEFLLREFRSGACNKKVPEFLFNLDPKYQLAFLRGYSDGDGHIRNNKRQSSIEITSGSINLAYDVWMLMLQNGIVSAFTRGKRSKGGFSSKNDMYYRVRATNGEAKKLCLEIDTPTENHQKQTFIRNNYLFCKVKKIEVAEPHECINFHVEDDNTFCLIGAATHNSPYSDEWKETLKRVNIQQKLGMLDADQIAEKMKIVKHRKAMMDRYQLMPYRFRGRIFSPDTTYNNTTLNENIKAAAEYSLPERILGALYESFSHLSSPWHSKLLQHRSPIEQYERTRLYGREAAFWNQPLRDFVNPYVTSAISTNSVGEGILRGALVGNIFLGGGLGATGLSSAFLGIYGGAHGAYESLTGDVYIPHEVRMKRDINNYFDRLKYLKARRLFEATGNTDYSDQMGESMVGLYPYGVDRKAWTNMYRAIPYEDRPFFDAFLRTTNKKERSRIAAIVPEGVRDLLQVRWAMNDGMKLEREVWDQNTVDEHLEDYFRNHHLPGESWLGWHPDVKLEDIKAKTIERKGLDQHDFGLGWYEQERRIERSPFIPGPINMSNPTGEQVFPELEVDTITLKQSLTQAMNQYGLTSMNISINSVPGPAGASVLNLQLKSDMNWDIAQYVSSEFART